MKKLTKIYKQITPNWIRRLIPPIISEKIRLIIDNEYRERERISSLTSREKTTTDLLGESIQILDPEAFLYGYREIFENEIYSFKPDKVPPKILDAGANIGLATIYWKRKFPNARITAFEPDPDAYQALVHNLKYNGYDDVNTIKKGLWKRNGSISFKFEGTTAGRIKKHSTEKGERVVSVTRLLDHLDEPIDMLKMDIEGAEVEVLLDSKKYLDRVKNLFVEYHSYPDKEQRIDEILSLLRQKDFRVHLKPGLCSKKPFLSVKKHKGLENTVNIFSYRK